MTAVNTNKGVKRDDQDKKRNALQVVERSTCGPLNGWQKTKQSSFRLASINMSLGRQAESS